MNIGDIYAGLQIITPPTQEPLTLAEALQHLRVNSDGGANDTYVNALIKAARQYAESYLRRALLTQTWKLALKNFPGRDYQNWPLSLTSEMDLYYKYNYIKLPFPPLQSVSSFTYMDSSGTNHSMTDANFTVMNGFTYNVNKDFEPGRITLPYAGIWPTDVLMPGEPIIITFVCGMKTISEQSSPPVGPTFEYWEGYGNILHAMKMLLAFWYEQRIPQVEIRSVDLPSGEEIVAQSLMMPYRIFD